MSGAAAEGKAGICSLFVAWPSRFTGQYGREAHLTQNNLLADSETERHLSRRRGSKSWHLQNRSPRFFVGLLGAIFRSVSVTEAG